MTKQLTPATAAITDAEILELLTAFGDMATKPVNKLIKGATSGFVKANGEFSQVWRDYAIRIAKECEAVATGESLQAASGTVSPAKVRDSFAGPVISASRLAARLSPRLARRVALSRSRSTLATVMECQSKHGVRRRKRR